MQVHLYIQLFISVFKSTTVQYGYPYSITVWTVSYIYGAKPYLSLVWVLLQTEKIGVMQTAQLGAIEPLSWAVILASQADKLAPGSELLRPAQAMPQVVQMSDLLNSFKPSENIMKHCLQGPSVILNVYFCILLARAIVSSEIPGDKHSQITHRKYQFA